MLRSTSSDGGSTWSAAKDTDLPHPGSSLEVLALADGRWLLVGNLVERGRSSITAMFSDDEGRTWKWRRPIAPRSSSAAGQFDYPSVLQTRDGHIHVTFSSTTDKGRCIGAAETHKPR